MIVNLDVPPNVLKLAEEQALQKQWSRKKYLENLIKSAVIEAERELKERGIKK